ncbi:helix-turn-helix domain-containing protein [Nocardioides ochotonae]|uniref:helix-turn-helix domain-containing protein n=1 Tax=Nocardioides ochotonae TaxID=2685869 RepID=UPI00140D180A|nr:helix-turn-helix transcriptional regulator [Nocardioides ochotonae]
MNQTNIRLNGQAEMRDIINTAIAEAGLNMSALSRETGIKYSRLYGGLRGKAWLHRRDVDAIANFLNIDVEDLIGGSIFKGDPRQSEFDYWPGPSRRVEPIDVDGTDLPERRTRALCCGCGSLAVVPHWADAEDTWETHGHSTAGFDGKDHEHPFGSRGRLTRELRCDRCRRTTTHALLARHRARDAAEQYDHAPTMEEFARKDRDALVGRLAEFGVTVTFKPQRKKLRTKGYAIKYWFDTGESRWRIDVDPNLPTRLQVTQVEGAWKSISTGDHGDIDWDPRDGVIRAPGDHGWDTATAELLTDVDRFLEVEKRRLAQHIRDGIAAQQTTRHHDEDEESWT